MMIDDAKSGQRQRTNKVRLCIPWYDNKRKVARNKYGTQEEQGRQDESGVVGDDDYSK